MALAQNIEINQASAADLDGLPGIGPATSTPMLEARAAQGFFRDWPDLMHRVKGIGRARAARLSAAGLMVNGQPFPQPSTATASTPTSAYPLERPKDQ